MEVKTAIKADRRNGMVFFLAVDYRTEAHLAARSNDIPKAKQYLADAADLFRECGADGHAVKAEELMSFIGTQTTI